MRPYLVTSVLALALIASRGCGGSTETKSDEPAGGAVEIKSLGVRLDLPADWKQSERNGGQWVNKSPVYGAQLQKIDAMPASLDEAKKGWMEGTVKDEGKKGEALYAVIEVEFPGDETMKMPYVYVVAPVGDGAVQCSGQLQAGADASELVEVCATMKAI